MSIGQAIKTCRTKKKMLQKELSKKIGISTSLMSMIEKGQRDPGFELVQKIAKELKIPYELLLLLACEPAEAKKKYKKQMRRISLATLDILSKI